MSGQSRRRYLCGVRSSAPSGSFTYGVGGWPFTQAVINPTAVSVGPALWPLIALISTGVVLTLALGRWQPILLTIAGLFSWVRTPRRTYPLVTVRVRETTVQLWSRALELSSDVGAEKIWLWFLPVDRFLSEMTRRGVQIQRKDDVNLL